MYFLSLCHLSVTENGGVQIRGPRPGALRQVFWRRWNGGAHLGNRQGPPPAFMAGLQMRRFWPFFAVQRDPERRWGQSYSYLQVKVCGPPRGRALGTVTQGPFAFWPPKADSFSSTGGGIEAKILWLSRTPSSPLMLTV